MESNKLSTDVSQVDSVTHVLEPRIDELLGKNKGSSKRMPLETWYFLGVGGYCRALFELKFEGVS